VGSRRIPSEASRTVEVVLALDPGTRAGWALFVEGILQEAGTFNDKSLWDQVADLLQGAEEGKATVVIEYPQWRKGSPMPPAKLIPLAFRAGELSGLYKREGHTVHLVRPTDWKGSVPKKIHQRRIEAVLSEEERGRLKDNHNAKDAAGIGLYHLGRLRR